MEENVLKHSCKNNIISKKNARYKLKKRKKAFMYVSGIRQNKAD